MKAIQTARRRRPIYVESRIDAPMDRVWDATQQPDQHERWDLRFGMISYLPPIDGEPQRFAYVTTVAPGVNIGGTGESLGERDRSDGTRWSGLKFWTTDHRSLIDAGAGYWRYIPTDTGVRFLTRYDYRPRWGLAGELIDRWVFRPIFGWATAWSFDRLRLWLEEGTPPERSRNQAVAHALAVGGLAGVFAYQGLVPKAFNPASLGVAVAALAGVALATSEGRPSGLRPLRHAPDRQPDVEEFP